MFLLWNDQKKKVDTSVLGGLSNVVAAWSVRKLGNTITTPVRACRSSDNAETDISFATGNVLALSSAAAAGGTLTSWVGANNATVAKWYDQSGNGLDAINATLAQRPSIVSSGSLITTNSVATLNYSGTNYLSVASPSLLDITTAMTVLVVFYNTGGHLVNAIIEKRDSAGGYHIFTVPSSQQISMHWPNSTNYDVVDFYPSFTANVYRTLSVRATRATSCEMKFNSTTVSGNFPTAGAGTSVTTVPFWIGYSTNPAYTFIGRIAEMIICSSSISDAQRDAYLTSTKTYFGT